MGLLLTSSDAEASVSLAGVVAPPAAGAVRAAGGERAGAGSPARNAEMNSSTVRRTARPRLRAPLGEVASVTARTP
ncbi:hypothetical protein AB1Y20_011118 [Prymnesium parvum]|uniref:Uncharacterized protein n=1 Tax=Prymnesium parvum TaxID=97485 RepID=A0AB34IN67_PRYPA